MTVDDTPADLVVTITDIRRHHCAPGVRRWFEANDLDFRDMLANGIPARTLVATGDELAISVVQDVMARNGR